MRAYISSLAVAGLFALALPSYSDDANDKGIDGGPVNSGGVTYDPTMGGRSPFIDDGTVKSGGTGRPGRAVDDGKIKTVGATAERGRTADESKVTQTNKKKKSKKAKIPATTPTN